MGARGPIPRREDELARPRARKGSDEQATLFGVRRETKEWEALPHWNDFARNFFESAKNSGQTDYYQDTDWSHLVFICEEIHAYQESQKPYPYEDKKTGEIRVIHPKRSGQWLTAILGGMSGLLLTEGERRRVRMELQEPPKEKADLKIVAMEQYASARGKGKNAK